MTLMPFLGDFILYPEMSYIIISSPEVSGVLTICVVLSLMNPTDIGCASASDSETEYRVAFVYSPKITSSELGIVMPLREYATTFPFDVDCINPILSMSHFKLPLALIDNEATGTRECKNTLPSLK